MHSGCGQQHREGWPPIRLLALVTLFDSMIEKRRGTADQSKPVLRVSAHSAR